MEYEIVYNSEDYLVINKPAGVVVNRAESVNGETVQDWIEKSGQLSAFSGQGSEEILFRKRSGICHRLDKETSGCLLIAKNPAALIHALKEFKERRVEKEYMALVHGMVNPKEGTIKLPLARTRFDREKFEVRFSGKIAETSWKVEKSFQRSAFSGQMPVTLVRLFPKTGRTHQIRVHLSHMGFPIWSDERYLRKDFLLEDRKHLSHHFLHAEVLRLKSISGEMIEARAKLPEDETGLISWINGE
jgi:23S rRNA pseudouridine1911/1915/1917 synthase